METKNVARERLSCATKWAVSVVLTMCALVSGAWAAPKETVLYSFTNHSDGVIPSSPLTVDNSGNLYGEAGGGDGGYGVVFKLKSGSMGWTETTIYTFRDASNNGANPVGGVTPGAPGTFYGVTFGGGIYDDGTVFELLCELPCPFARQQVVLQNFQRGGSSSTMPNRVIRDQAGNLYGTTVQGGSLGLGNVFELSPSSGGGWSYQEIFTFVNEGDGKIPYGEYPYGALTMDAAGNLYGTTFGGGVYGGGTVFELKNTAKGWDAAVLYNFTGGDNGYGPLAGVTFDGKRNLFGTTPGGGLDEVGTVFELTPAQGYWVHRVLYSFTGGPDGGEPGYGSLAVDAAGNLFGTTQYGGYTQQGTVFELRRDRRAHRWKETVLHSFTGAPDGLNPAYGIVLDSAGNLYGTTPLGGTDGWGVVYEITR